MKMTGMVGFLALMVSSASSADTITVCADGCEFTSIIAAIDAASNGDVIQLAAETYSEGTTISIGGKTITLRGATDKSGSAASVIDGADAYRVISCDGFGPSTVLLENLVIQNGDADSAAGVDIYFDVTAVVRNCRFLENKALDSTGGALGNNGTVDILNCSFVGNQAENGGAVDNGGSMTVRNCTFTENFASSGYGAVNLGEQGLAEDCLFVGNIAGRGGAMGASTGSVVRNCTFDSNIATDLSEGGGAIFFRSDSPTLIACTFVNNTAANGGAIVNYFSSSPTIQDCVFDLNSSTSYGGAIVNSSNSSPRIESSVFQRNAAGLSGSGAIDSTDPQCTPDVAGSLFCENTPADISGQWNDQGGNNFNSTCSCPDQDADGTCDSDDQCPGEPDVDTDKDGIVDCLDGCPTDPEKTEPGQCGCNEVDTGIAGDYDCDGDFDADDYAAMGVALGICPGDLNGDAKVDGADLNIILGAWGVCP
ncbi:MAG: right-handed parallel beta-helix repeat-containing protein [Phycisphaerales bacterium]|nr:right-handed parallel beta-helix repeat-containing protein [Phycisphaerales bacterium]